MPDYPPLPRKDGHLAVREAWILGQEGGYEPCLFAIGRESHRVGEEKAPGREEGRHDYQGQGEANEGDTHAEDRHELVGRVKAPEREGDGEEQRDGKGPIDAGWGVEHHHLEDLLEGNLERHVFPEVREEVHKLQDEHEEAGRQEEGGQEGRQKVAVEEPRSAHGYLPAPPPSQATTPTAPMTMFGSHMARAGSKPSLVPRVWPPIRRAQ